MVRTQTVPSVYGALLPRVVVVVVVLVGLVCAKQRPAMPRDNAAIASIFVFMMRTFISLV
ncbi:MAG TPA: hypothetical protein DHU55_02085 [Blastocatellia bacterium]|nr:hypothetical protein [Blastocatellia bacterium]